MVLVSIVVIGYMARDFWFFRDGWDYLAMRDIGSLDSLLSPRAGHWTIPTVVAFRALYGLVEMDYWPWYYLPRLLLYGGMALVFWRVLRWRGTDLWLALGVYGVMLFYGTTGRQTGHSLGNPLAHTVLLIACVMVTKIQTPRRWHQLVLAGVFTLGVVSAGLGVVWFVGIGAALVLSGRARRWWPALLVPAAVYGTWYTTYGSSAGNTPALDLQAFLGAPDKGLQLLSTAAAEVFALPAEYGPIFLLAVLAGIATLVVSNRFGMFEGALLSSLAVYMLLIVLVRLEAGERPDSGRYLFTVGFILLLMFLPHIPVPKQWDVYALIGGLILVMGVGHVRELRQGISNWEELSRESQPVVTAAAKLLSDDEPFVKQAPVEDFTTGPLTAERLLNVISEQWPPRTSSTRESTREARAQLRMAIRPGDESRGRPVVFQEDANDGGCLALARGERARGQVRGPGAIVLKYAKDAKVRLRWEDRYGIGRRTTKLKKKNISIVIAPPDGDTTMSIRNESDKLWVCGVA
jgi:hypothetical protein